MRFVYRLHSSLQLQVQSKAAQQQRFYIEKVPVEIEQNQIGMSVTPVPEPRVDDTPLQSRLPDTHFSATSTGNISIIATDIYKELLDTEPQQITKSQENDEPQEISLQIYVNNTKEPSSMLVGSTHFATVIEDIQEVRCAPNSLK